MIRELAVTIEGRGEVKGFIFEQVKASEKAYIYKSTSEDNVYFEVFRKKVNTQFGIVSYPKSKSFGKWAWCCSSLKRAEKIFNEINN